MDNGGWLLIGLYLFMLHHGGRYGDTIVLHGGGHRVGVHLSGLSNNN